MDFTGKPLASMVYVERSGWQDDARLRRWLDKAVRFTSTLPPKKR